MRLFILLLISILLLFQYDFWFGKNGYLDYKRVAQEIQQHKQENEKLSQRNQVLAAEIKDLKQGFDAIEEKARADLKMIKPNEVFYHIVKETK
ncbi:cell division protein FtsB [[Haemophilus] felis]|uniref:Cell division protein FtsB n=1 Tax=[Haemophilus] felis TaxID=123822 RepID=A0A1T0B7W0_9PAST|nr:cell division protein FtsB [[Haemophilus] felis]NBI40809.1 cell division protein FtsB [[Haemophilus] felis]OOS06164.1 cell division protein FtsB [[Haemophilus] felis]